LLNLDRYRGTFTKDDFFGRSDERGQLFHVGVCFRSSVSDFLAVSI
jgi:hypothetical protein